MSLVSAYTGSSIDHLNITVTDLGRSRSVALSCGGRRSLEVSSTDLVGCVGQPVGQRNIVVLLESHGVMLPGLKPGADKRQLGLNGG